MHHQRWGDAPAGTRSTLVRGTSPRCCLDCKTEIHLFIGKVKWLAVNIKEDFLLLEGAWEWTVFGHGRVSPSSGICHCLQEKLSWWVSVLSPPLAWSSISVFPVMIRVLDGGTWEHDLVTFFQFLLLCRFSSGLKAVTGASALSAVRWGYAQT